MNHRWHFRNRWTTRQAAQVAALSAALTVPWLATGCASGGAGLPQEEGLHPRLTRFCYIEEGKLVTLAVDTEATRLREKEKVIPFAIAIANNGLRRMTLTRESLTLIDDQGRRYALASVQEGRAIGTLQLYDYKLSEHFLGVISNRFTAHTELKTVFFPVPVTETRFASRGLVQERTELPKQSWTWDVVYFPHPEGPIEGRKFELWLKTAELEQPVFVKLAVR
jgi:hypothetical protein